MRLNRPPLLLSALLVGGALASAVWLTMRTERLLEGLREPSGPRSLSTALLIPDSGSVRHLADGDPTTALRDINHRKWEQAFALPTDAPAWFQNSAFDRPFVLMTLGVTHFPGKPPMRYQPNTIEIWSGDQSSEEAFLRRGRPRRLHLVFFHQQIYDFDRDYRLPDEPVFWAERTITLDNRMGRQSFELDWLNFKETIKASPRFPREVKTIWLRLEVIDYYPGTGDEGWAIALSEVELKQSVLREESTQR